MVDLAIAPKLQALDGGRDDGLGLDDAKEFHLTDLGNAERLVASTAATCASPRGSAGSHGTAAAGSATATARRCGARS